MHLILVILVLIFTMVSYLESETRKRVKKENNSEQLEGGAVQDSIIGCFLVSLCLSRTIDGLIIGAQN